MNILHNFKNGELDFGYVLIYRHSDLQPMKDIPIRDIKKLGGVKTVKRINIRGASYHSPEYFLGETLKSVLSIVMKFDPQYSSYFRFYKIDRVPNYTFLKVKYPDVDMKCVYLDFSVFEKMLSECKMHNSMLNAFLSFIRCKYLINDQLSSIASASALYAEEDYTRMLDIVCDFYNKSLANSKRNLDPLFK